MISAKHPREEMRRPRTHEEMRRPGTRNPDKTPLKMVDRDFPVGDGLPRPPFYSRVGTYQ